MESPVRKSNLVVLSLVMLLALPAAAGVNDALAAELKIGVVDVEYIIHTSTKGKAAKSKLKKLFEDKQKQLDAEQKKLLELKKEIEEQSEMATPEKRKAKVLEYQQGLLKLQELYLKNQQELAKKEVELMKPILTSLEKILTEFAKDGQYDIIMNRSEQGVLFTKPDHDLTKQVLEKLNAG
jgi:outer membrane protein